MATEKGSCPLTVTQQIELFFIENRTRVLELAAFLDRLERAAAPEGAQDFRLRSLRAALEVLSGPDVSKLMRIQMLFSDQDLSLLDHLDRKSALGAPSRQLQGDEP